MDLADQWLGVPKLLTPEEFVDPNVDEQSMLTYLSQFPNAKLQPGAPLRKKTNAGKVITNFKIQIFFPIPYPRQLRTLLNSSRTL